MITIEERLNRIEQQLRELDQKLAQATCPHRHLRLVPQDENHDPCIVCQDCGKRLTIEDVEAIRHRDPDQLKRLLGGNDDYSMGEYHETA